MSSRIGEEFRAWVLAQKVARHEVISLDEDHLYVDAGELQAEVNFYPLDEATEIVEYLIERGEGEDPLFFLHFALDDMGRAKELFGQMSEAFEATESRKTTRVLLCCTSGLTTTLFAARLGEAAKTLSLDYEFTAVPVERALRQPDDYAAVLLAPQVAFMRQQMKKVYSQAVVFEIPARVFGSYDAGAALRLLLHALRDAQDAGTPEVRLHSLRDLSDNRQVLIVTLFSMRDHTRIGYRLYSRGTGVAEGVVRKPDLDFRDVEDLIETISLRGVAMDTLDAIGIAVPGVTFRRTITLPNVLDESYELGMSLTKKLGIPVYVDNNCNAAAVGCYVSQTEVENLVFYRHAFGHEAGGFGTVIDGKLLKGHHNLAGEPKYFENSFAYDTSFGDAIWNEDGMHELALNVISASMALVAPDAVYLAVDTVDDAEAFRDLLLEVFEDEYVPTVHIVKDYVERVYLGTLALALQKLRDPDYRSLGVIPQR